MQNIISANSNELSMSSQEISDLVGARHDSVKRSIERLAEQGIITLPPTVEKATGGRPSIEYVFSGEKGKRDSIIVVAQLSPEFTARLVDRWQELEAKKTQAALNPANMSRLQLLEMAMQAEQERIALEQKVEKIQPMADALIRISRSDEYLNLTMAAKVAGHKPRKFNLFLESEMRWIYRRPGNGKWCARQEFINRGYVDNKYTTVERSDGTTKDEVQCFVTPKGMARLSMIFGVQPDLIGGV